jgi:hypothetical protein
MNNKINFNKKEDYIHITPEGKVNIKKKINLNGFQLQEISDIGHLFGYSFMVYRDFQYSDEVKKKAINKFAQIFNPKIPEDELFYGDLYIFDMSGDGQTIAFDQKIRNMREIYKKYGETDFYVELDNLIASRFSIYNQRNGDEYAKNQLIVPIQDFLKKYNFSYDYFEGGLKDLFQNTKIKRFKVKKKK